MKKSKKSESLEAVHTHTPVSYKKEKQKSKQRVIEFNLSKSVVIITIIVVILVTLTTAKVVTTLVQAEDNKKLADTEQQNNERVVYVNSTTKDESGNIINETDENGNIIQVPVPKGYSASQIEGETTASKGFVIYEGDVDWSTILVGDDNSSSTTNTETEDTIADETNKESEPIQQEVENDNKVEENTENIESYENIEEDATDDVTADDTTTDGTDTTDETETTVTQQDINIFNLQKSRNQYVWVPVDDPSRIYGVDSNGKIWGKLYDFSSSGRSALNWTENNAIMNITNRTSYRESDVVWATGEYAYDTDGYSYMSQYGLGETRYEMLAQELEENYYEIIASIKKYGGFYIGRYETGGLNETAVVRKMDTNIVGHNWYTMYKKCLTLKGNNDNIKTSMILGSLWDETIEWLVKSGATNSEGTTLTYYLVGSYSTTWGNYKNATFKYIAQNSEKPEATENKNANSGTRIPTGSAEYTKANNIYDMAGNMFDWTIEAYFMSDRVNRGGFYYSDGDYSSAAERSNYGPSYDYDYIIHRRPTVVAQHFMLSEVS